MVNDTLTGFLKKTRMSSYSSTHLISSTLVILGLLSLSDCQPMHWTRYPTSANHLEPSAERGAGQHMQARLHISERYGIKKLQQECPCIALLRSRLESSLTGSRQYSPSGRKSMWAVSPSRWLTANTIYV